MAHKNDDKEIKRTSMPVQSSSTPGNPNNDDRQGGGDDGDVGIVTKTRPKTKKPSLYKVLLLNDDFTPMEFVVHVLQRFLTKISMKQLKSCFMFTKMVSAYVAFLHSRSQKRK